MANKEVFFRRLLLRNSSKALDYFEALPAGPDKTRLFKHVIEDWLNSQLTQANSRGPSDQHADGSAASSSYLQFAREDPVLTLMVLRKMGTASNQMQLVEDIALEWSQRDPQAAFKYAQQIDDTSSEQVFISGMIVGLAQEAPGDAALLIDLLPPGESRRRALTTVASRWVLTEPAAAADWVKSLPPSDDQAALVGGVVENLARRQPDMCLPWIDSLPAGEVRDAGSTAYALELSTQSPEVAIRWAEDHVSASGFEVLRKTVLRHWLGSDAESAARWIMAANMPDMEKTQLVFPGRHY